MTFPGFNVIVFRKKQFQRSYSFAVIGSENGDPLLFCAYLLKLFSYSKLFKTYGPIDCKDKLLSDYYTEYLICSKKMGVAYHLFTAKHYLYLNEDDFEFVCKKSNGIFYLAYPSYNWPFTKEASECMANQPVVNPFIGRTTESEAVNAQYLDLFCKYNIDNKDILLVYTTPSCLFLNCGVPPDAHRDYYLILNSEINRHYGYISVNLGKFLEKTIDYEKVKDLDGIIKFINQVS